jgi:hypothetical protein
MNSKLLALSASALLATGAAAFSQAFTPGDLVVSVYGSTTSTSITDGQVTPITLQEYSLPTATSSTLQLTDVLPTSSYSGGVGIVGEDGSSSEGTIQLSGNDEYLTIGGYDATAAAAGINSSTSSTYAGDQWGESTVALAQSSDTNVPRVAAVIDSNGNVDTSTVLNDIYPTNNPRGVYSPDGSSIYISGQGTASGNEGIYLTSKGNNTTGANPVAPTPIYTLNSTRDLTEYNGGFYYSADQKNAQTGIFEYSTPPTSSQGSSTGTRITPASGTIYTNTGGSTGSGATASVNFSPEGFAFVTPTLLYVADTGAPKVKGTGDGGIQKWSYINNAWVLDYTLTDSNFVAPGSADNASHGETGFESLALQVVGSNVDIYAVSYTAGDADANGLYAVVDSESATSLPGGETFTEIQSAPGANTAGSTADFNFKGVSFAPTAPVPEPSTWATMLGGLGMLFAFARNRRRSA